MTGKETGREGGRERKRQGNRDGAENQGWRQGSRQRKSQESREGGKLRQAGRLSTSQGKTWWRCCRLLFASLLNEAFS